MIKKTLVRIYKNELNVLLATFDQKDRVEDFFNNSPYVEGITFTQAVGDSLLRKLFPARQFPHQVWIDSNGVVAAITDGKATTKDNVAKFTKGEPFDFVPKINEELDPFVANAVQPLILYNYEDNIDKILKYSYLSNHRKGFSGSTGIEMIDTTHNIFRFRSVNAHFVMLYNFAYNGGLVDSAMHLKTRVLRLDNGNTLPKKHDLKNYDQYYCYDLITRYNPDTEGLSTAVRQQMVPDLDRTFGVRSTEEVHMLDCWVIRKLPGNDDFTKKMGNGRGYENINKIAKGNIITVHNIPMFFFFQNINHYTDIPIVDEIEYEGRRRMSKISFEITWNPDNIPAMQEELRKYGLDIFLDKRPRNIIVLRDE